MPETFNLKDNRDSIVFNAFYTLLSQLAKEEKDAFIEEHKGQPTIEIDLKINGKEFQFSEILRRYRDQLQWLIAKEAEKQLSEKVYLATKPVWDLLKDVETQMRNKLVEAFPDLNS